MYKLHCSGGHQQSLLEYQYRFHWSRNNDDIKYSLSRHTSPVPGPAPRLTTWRPAWWRWNPTQPAACASLGPAWLGRTMGTSWSQSWSLETVWSGHPCRQTGHPLHKSGTGRWGNTLVSVPSNLKNHLAKEWPRNARKVAANISIVECCSSATIYVYLFCDLPSDTQLIVFIFKQSLDQAKFPFKKRLIVKLEHIYNIFYFSIYITSNYFLQTFNTLYLYLFR